MCPQEQGQLVNCLLGTRLPGHEAWQTHGDHPAPLREPAYPVPCYVFLIICFGSTSTPIPRMKHLSRENNFFYLCTALVVILFSSAVVRQFLGTWGEDIFTLVMVAMLVLSIKSLNTTLTWHRINIGLLSLLLLLSVLTHFSKQDLFDYLSLGLLLLYFSRALRSVSMQVLFVGKRVNINRIVGSVSLYLLLGLIWTLIYLVLLTFDANALSGIQFGNWRESFPQAAYYSFVTLTTLGYGDILPTSHLARFFAYMEAIAGVFYMAIVVASLVSIAITESTNKKQQGENSGTKNNVIGD